MKRFWLVFALVGLLGIVPRTARAESPRATFALIIGSNASVDTNLQPLRYADDDAARYLDLFRLLGARTYLLTRLDDNTKRLHPQAAAEASDPKKASYDTALAQLTADVTQAAQRGVETTLYFVYAGHGNVQNGQGYITLEDLRISGNDLAATFQKIPATRIHVIADACASYFLAYSRGPGGERRPLDTIGLAPALGNDSRIGLLLSTSSARESHEWDAFQSGVFSHEVRSGLYGAADADNDGQVSYREIAAFVTRANASVPNERYRPDIHARAPQGTETLLDLRKANGRRIEIDGKHAGHYFLEDSRGVRIADIHNGADQRLSIIRPAPNGRVYLRRISDDKELVIDPRPDVVSVADLEAVPARVASRGAAHEAFNSLFLLPFDMDVVAAYPVMMCVPAERPPPAPAPVVIERASPPNARKTAGIALLGAGGLALAVGATLTVTSFDRNDSSLDQQHASILRDQVHKQQLIAGFFYAGGAISAVTGLVLLVMPSNRVASTVTKLRAAATRDGAFLGYGASF
jgi:hypothetical protein